MTFKYSIAENDENFLLSKHFLLVFTNQSLKIPWMTGVGGGGNLSQLVYLTPYP